MALEQTVEMFDHGSLSSSELEVEDMLCIESSSVISSWRDQTEFPRNVDQAVSATGIEVRAVSIRSLCNTI